MRTKTTLVVLVLAMSATASPHAADQGPRFKPPNYVIVPAPSAESEPTQGRFTERNEDTHAQQAINPPWCLYCELIKGLPTALVALVVGLIAASIALRQAQIAKTKLKLDLFDKRYPIFLETWQILSEVVQKGTRTKQYGLGNPFSNFIPQARFLFGKDIEAYLDEAVKKWTDLWALEGERGSPGEAAKNAAKVKELRSWFFDQASTGVKNVFGRYLDFESWK